MMHDNDPFLRWFVPWKGTRLDEAPIGWYTLTDLEAAFHAGRADQNQQVLDEILTRSKAIEDLLRGTGTWTPMKD